MERRKDLLAIVIVSIFLGIILSIQFKTVNKTVGVGVLPTQRSQQLAQDLKKAQSDKESQTKRIEELEEKISKYEKGEVDKNTYAENIYNDMQKYRTLAGYLDMEGPGVIMEVSDPEIDVKFGEGLYLIDQLDYILQTISILNAADAEAISINDQRYTAFTEIERAGDHVMINGVPTNTPITIKAIGDTRTLESVLTIKNGIVDALRYADYTVQVKKENKVEIPKSKKVKELIFAKPVEESENR